ncbi:hypothetical protein FHW19_004505 [Ochrobactrum anthropi]|nr:hypothetical protein [Brucella anthropi]
MAVHLIQSEGPYPSVGTDGKQTKTEPHDVNGTEGLPQSVGKVDG